MSKQELIKKLRDMTQAGVMDVVKALKENNDDLDKAAAWLREKGIAKAAKKADAIAAEGITLAYEKNNKAVIFELNCQTDFVAKNDDFIKLANEIRDALIASNAKTIEEANALMLGDKSIDQACKELTGRIGEKIALRRFTILSKKANESFGIYNHSNNRISTLVLLDAANKEEVGKDVAMHATAMRPKYLNANKVDQAWLASEKEIIRKQTIEEGKPANRVDAIVEGRIHKTLAEICLVDQIYVKDPSLKVSQYVKSHNANLTEYVRFEVGEGIEKQVCDFAAEVAQQMQ